ncbi:MAG: ubiquinone biosynthesis protein [Bdellovibrionales bacterium RIFCSPHIGHO2_01_FULL_40_29]|nr:MAG: ubiquinone biosynthesis protein [Bdellovibrionales bacterium RIFCSPHIGHO2_01_FULL_40_29]OFZ35382.1 MAG: ubiquinone biosynthesis protein [Bdellovibrionales bacterium RIFCSPHIGHO2_02_FULL_40_15]
MFAKHGLKNLVEKINLGNLVSSTDTSEEKELLSLPTRVRLSFEELGPTFVKFGQLLASRPDLIPDDYLEEMLLLHDQVQPLDYKIIEQVLAEELGPQWKQNFSHVDEIPLGSASIAQVHKAILNNGTSVVLKVQRPGIVSIINDDLNVLYFIAELLEKYIPEVRLFNPVAMVDEYFKTLELETNFVIEGNNVRKFKENFKAEENVFIPNVHFDLTTERILVMDMMTGRCLTQDDALLQQGIQAEEVIKLGLRTYLKMVFIDGFFHGDLHAGNFFVFPQNKIGLIDFGVVGRLNNKTQNAIVNMLLALSKEDYLRLAYEYVDLAPFSETVNVDQFAKELQSLISPYYGLTTKHMNIGKILMSSASVAAAHGLSVPAELMMFFKSIISIEGLGQRIVPDFDFLKYTLSMVGEVAQHQFQPAKFIDEAGLLLRESRGFLNSLPRQLNLILRRLNSPDHRSRIDVQGLDDFRRSIESSFNLLFLGIVIAALIISSSLIYPTQVHWTLAGMPGISLIGYILAIVFGVVAVINYFKKS